MDRCGHARQMVETAQTSLMREASHLEPGHVSRMREVAQETPIIGN